MIGRASLGRPWLIGQIARGLRGEDDAAPSFADRRDAAIEHYEGLLALMGVAIGVKHVRKHIAAYADDAASVGRSLPRALREELMTTEEPKIALGILERLYDDVADDMQVRAVA
jgi:tRNA-dihydrouridine synthase